jgi:hypothetical protein
MRKTRLSSKGVELEVEDRGDVVVLRPLNPFPPTTFEQVRGCLKYDGPPISIERMHDGIAREARRMWAEFERQSE